MSHLHFVGGEKGGVGKSLFARLLAQHLIDRAKPLRCFDTDRSHGSLLRYYADYAEPAPLDGHDSLDRVLEAAAADPDLNVVVDLAAQTQASLDRWFHDAGVAEVAAEVGAGITVWHVLDSGRDSLPPLQRWLDGPNAGLPLVVVLNEVRGDGFEQLTDSGLLARAEAAGARTLRLRKLPDALLQKVDGQGASFWAALQPGALGLLDRQRLKLWLHRSGEALDALGV
ncbi:mobilization protein [Aquabacterium sp. J223]|uniref:mobilization protein n=1 Tax=Aquabacterium sp. J223 TaxID=2898431 RepID=UPI0021ADA4F6|nr:mobilization protein [Aquabacterium sp. J223]UUX96478.1 mobilization protein [Aquabacterium sp. J223]